MKVAAETRISPMAELYPKVAEPAWFCIRSHLKHEHIAAAHLRLIPEVDVFNPQLRLLRSTRRGRVWFTESLFPNYLFARFVLDSRLEKVRCTPAVTRVVRFGTEVPSIPAPVIEALRRDLEALGGKVLTDAPEEGEEVEVSAGVFKGLTGQVTRVLPAKQRVQILLDFMGRSIAAELSLALLLFRKREAANLALPEARPSAESGALRPGVLRAGHASGGPGPDTVRARYSAEVDAGAPIARALAP